MYLLILVIALAVQAPSEAQEQAATEADKRVSEQQDVEATPDAEDDPVICRQGEAVTGSRIRKTKQLCYTESRWAEIEAHSKELAREIQAGNVNPTAGKPHGSGGN